MRSAVRSIADRKSTRLNSSHRCISYAVFCLKKKNNKNISACLPNPKAQRRTLRHNPGRGEICSEGGGGAVVVGAPARILSAVFFFFLKKRAPPEIPPLPPPAPFPS